MMLLSNVIVYVINQLLVVTVVNVVTMVNVAILLYEVTITGDLYQMAQAFYSYDATPA